MKTRREGENLSPFVYDEVSDKMAFKKQLLNMSDRRSAFYFTVKELVRRGYERSVAKYLVRTSPWPAYAKKEPIAFVSSRVLKLSSTKIGIDLRRLRPL